MNADPVSVRAVVQWPHHAEAQGRYLVVADVELDETSGWPYAREEFIIGCVLEGGTAFRVEALGSTGLVLHRFGGTYGPVRFVVSAERDPRPDGSDGLRLTLVTEGGVPFQMLPLPVLPKTSPASGRPAAVEGSRLIQTVPQRRPRPSRPAVEAAPPRPRRSALLIAPAAADVQAFGGVLGARYGFDHIRLQTDGAGIVDAYEELIAGTGPHDAVVIYLRGHALRHDGAVALLIGDQRPSEAMLGAFHRRLTAVTNNVTVIYDVDGLTPGWHPGPTSNPQLVELYADDDEAPERDAGVFSDELVQVLIEAADLQITWATLIDQVRRRVVRVAPGQRPTVAGPAQRVLFGTAEARSEPSLPIVMSRRGDLVQILGARMLNVQIGDEFAIRADASGSQPILGTAVVEGLAQFGAYARVELLDPAVSIPIGARAHRTRAMAERLAVRLPPFDEDLQRLYAAVRSSTMIQPSDDDGWVYDVQIDDRYRLTIHDRIGPLSDPVSAMSGSGRVFADLERLARAAALRRLADDPGLSLAPVAVDLGRVADGELLPPDEPPLLYAGDAISVSLRNDNERPVYVSLIEIGVAADVAVLTRSLPAGIRLDPGDRYVLGVTTLTDDARGMKIEWPAGLAPTGPRPETILVITTAEPHDLGSLEQQGVRAPVRRTPLAQMLAQANYGSSRAIANDQDDRSGAYAIRAITFDLAPGARPVTIPEDWPAPGSIMNAEELRSLAPRFRRKELQCDDDLVAKIVSDVAEYNAYARAVPGPNPPPPLDELLRLMGWLIYEASWDAVQHMPSTLNATMTKPDELRRGLVASDQISALADAARRLPWPQFAGRALGAVRAQALAESKRDTEAGYRVARNVHQEAQRHYDNYSAALSTNTARERYIRDLDEVLLQLALAETGTACRKAERVISRWSEDFTGEDEDAWLETIFGDLSSAADIGELAIDTGRRIQAQYGFVDSVTEDRLALHSALQNPGIMTARASALLLALGPAMQRIGLRQRDFPTWEHWEAREIGRFTMAYAAIEAPVLVDNQPVPMRRTVLRQLIHMRLNLALLKPGHHLPSTPSLDPVLEMADLDDAALAALSARLAPTDGGPGHERGLGAAMMPAVINSIRACRGRGPDDRSYDQWRVDWFRLDRFSNESGRRTRLEEALAASR